jgi:predicted TIM-barrel fold metal-dependent hydrolase
MSKSFPLPKRIIDAHNHVWGGDLGATKIIDTMDACRIETTVVLGTNLMPIVGNNEFILRAVQKHPRRLVGGVFVDPREGAKAIDTVRHYHAEGVRIVKLFPNYGYFPDDPGLRPFWDAVAELKMAVLSHCGWLAAGPGVAVASYYSHPGRFEKVIRLYPDTIFIMAHMGGIAGFLETVMLTTRTPNTYVDTAPGQGLWVLETTGAIAASIPPGRLLWGADSTDQRGLIPRYRKALVKLGFGPHLEKIYYSNARGLLEKIGALEPKAEARTTKPAAPARKCR